MTGLAARGPGAGALCVLTASLLWGTTGTAATFAPAVGPLTIGSAAMGIGGLLQALTATHQIVHARTELRVQARLVLLGAVAVAIYPLAFYASMRMVGVAVGTVVSIGSAPLASALIERVVDRHRLSGRWVMGAALGLAGIVLLCWAESDRPLADSESALTTVLGLGLALLAGITYAVYSWAARRAMQRGVVSRAAMGAIFGLGGVLLLPVLLATRAEFTAAWTNTAVGIYMAVVPMFIGYTFFGWGLVRVSASTATALSLLEPAVAAVLAVLVVGEHLAALGWVGIVLVFGSLTALTVPFGAPTTPGRWRIRPCDDDSAPTDPSAGVTTNLTVGDPIHIGHGGGARPDGESLTG